MIYRLLLHELAAQWSKTNFASRQMSNIDFRSSPRFFDIFTNVFLESLQQKGCLKMTPAFLDAFTHFRVFLTPIFGLF